MHVLVVMEINIISFLARQSRNIHLYLYLCLQSIKTNWIWVEKKHFKVTKWPTAICYHFLFWSISLIRLWHLWPDNLRGLMGRAKYIIMYMYLKGRIFKSVTLYCHKCGEKTKSTIICPWSSLFELWNSWEPGSGLLALRWGHIVKMYTILYFVLFVFSHSREIN